jgi:hypothetical protein
MIYKNGYANIMQTKKIQRIILNIGVGHEAVVDRKQVIPALFALELVTGQRPHITRARKSIDKFGLRRKMPIGAKVTLRNKEKLYTFLGEWLQIFQIPSSLQQESLETMPQPARADTLFGLGGPKGGQSPKNADKRNSTVGVKDLFVFKAIERHCGALFGPGLRRPGAGARGHGADVTICATTKMSHRALGKGAS